MTGKQNKLATQPMVSLIVGMSVPAMLSMLVTALYNVVDSIYVARFSETALTAVSLVFPLQQLVIAVGIGTAVGVNSLISRSLGARDHEEASRATRHGLMLAIASGLVFILIGACSGLLLQYFTNTPAVLQQANDYAGIVVGMSGFVIYSMMCEKIIQATGNMIIPMIQVLTGAVVNIILDPILIFGYLGMPSMGVRGAAIATVIGQIVSCCIGIYALHFHQKGLDANLRHFHLVPATVRRIYQVGLPNIVMQSVASFMVSGMNLILVQFSETAVAVLGVYFKLQSFIFLPVFGVGQGTMPVLGFSYGAGNRKRMAEAFLVSVVASVVLLVLGMLAFQIFPETMMGWFTEPSMWANGTPELVTMGAQALRIISWSYVGAGFSICCMTVFQSTGHGMASLLSAVLRQIVAILPIAWGMARVVGLDGVWYAFPIAEVLSVVATVLMLIHIDRTDFRYLTPAPQDKI